MFFAKPHLKTGHADQEIEIALAHHQAGRLDEAEHAYRMLLQDQPDNCDATRNLGELLLQANQPEQALSFLQAAVAFDPANGQSWLSLLECQVRLKAWNEAESLLEQAEASGLGRTESARIDKIAAQIEQNKHIEAAARRFPGSNYLDWLKWLHLTIKPETYVEIGVETGRSLQFAQRPTRSVGIDPEVNIVVSLESWSKLYKLPSDDFFAQHDLRQVLDAESVDMAFIDGLHTFDQALKDFINIERYSDPETVVAFHDVFPVTAVTAARDRETYFWLGDTWKVVLILKEMRPDLKIITLPAFPSGLTLVTGLDSGSTRLSQEIDAIVERWMNVEPDAYMAGMDGYLTVIENDFAVVSNWLKCKSSDENVEGHPDYHA